jgi:CHASE2 domain-containing sensor protein
MNMLSRSRKRWRRWHKVSAWSLLYVLTAVTLSWLGAYAAPTMVLYDLYNGLQAAPVDQGRVVIVGYREADAARYGDWPVSDAVVASLADRALAAGAASVTITGNRAFRLEPGGAELDALIQRTDRLQFAIDLRGAHPGTPFLQAPARVGSAVIYFDTGGQIRRVRGGGPFRGQDFLSIELATVEPVMRDAGQPLRFSGGLLQFGAQTLPPLGRNFGGYWDNYGIEPVFLPQARQRVVAPQLSLDALHAAAPGSLSGKTVIFCAQTAGARAQHTRTSPIRGRVSVCEALAQGVNNLLAVAAGERRFVRPLPEWAEHTLLGVLSFGVLALVLWWRRWPWIMASVGALIVGWMLIGYLAFLAGWWLPVVPVLVSLILAPVVRLLWATLAARQLGWQLATLLDLVDSFADPLVVVDRQQTVRLANRAFYSLFGALPKQIKDRPLAELLELDPVSTLEREALNAWVRSGPERGARARVRRQALASGVREGLELLRVEYVDAVAELDARPGVDSLAEGFARAGYWAEKDGRPLSLLLARFREPLRDADRHEALQRARRIGAAVLAAGEWDAQTLGVIADEQSLGALGVEDALRHVWEWPLPDGRRLPLEQLHCAQAWWPEDGEDWASLSAAAELRLAAMAEEPLP